MKADMFDLVLYCGFWLGFVIGCLTHDVWLCAPAAFFILLDHVGPRK